MQVLNDFLAKISQFILTPLEILLFACALLLFLWGVFNFVRNADNSEARVVGGRHILWGVIGMVIMFSVYGIIRIILGTFGIPNPF